MDEIAFFAPTELTTKIDPLHAECHKRYANMIKEQRILCTENSGLKKKNEDLMQKLETLQNPTNLIEIASDSNHHAVNNDSMPAKENDNLVPAPQSSEDIIQIDPIHDELIKANQNLATEIKDLKKKLDSTTFKFLAYKSSIKKKLKAEKNISPHTNSPILIDSSRTTPIKNDSQIDLNNQPEKITPKKIAKIPWPLKIVDKYIPARKNKKPPANPKAFVISVPVEQLTSKDLDWVIYLQSDKSKFDLLTQKIQQREKAQQNEIDQDHNEENKVETMEIELEEPDLIEINIEDYIGKKVWNRTGINSPKGKLAPGESIMLLQHKDGSHWIEPTPEDIVQYQTRIDSLTVVRHNPHSVRWIKKKSIAGRNLYESSKI